jgi:hypothetical protein
MKKGMSVKLEDGREFCLVDSVNYKNERYFAATSTNPDVDELYFFKASTDEAGTECLELIDYNANAEVIDALINHISQTMQS